MPVSVRSLTDGNPELSPIFQRILSNFMGNSHGASGTPSCFAASLPLSSSFRPGEVALSFDVLSNHGSRSNFENALVSVVPYSVWKVRSMVTVSWPSESVIEFTPFSSPELAVMRVCRALSLSEFERVFQA